MYFSKSIWLKTHSARLQKDIPHLHPVRKILSKINKTGL